MLEARNAYGWGLVGTDKGFDWEFIPNEFNSGGFGFHERVKGGCIFPDEETAIKAGKKWLRKYNGSRFACKYGLRHGKIIAVKNRRTFEY